MGLADANTLEVTSEICSVCGRDVSRRISLFVNRVPHINDYQTKMEMGRRCPHEGWICIICDNTDSGGVMHNVEEIEFFIKFGRQVLLRVGE